jgi:hypothetical protein
MANRYNKPNIISVNSSPVTDRITKREIPQKKGKENEYRNAAMSEP